MSAPGKVVSRAAFALASGIMWFIRSSRPAHIGPCGVYSLLPDPDARTLSNTVFKDVATHLETKLGAPDAASDGWALRTPLGHGGIAVATISLQRTDSGARLRYSIRELRWRGAEAFTVAIALLCYWASASPVWAIPLCAYLYLFLRQLRERNRSTGMDSAANQLAPMTRAVGDVIYSYSCFGQVARSMPRLRTHRGVDSNVRVGLARYFQPAVVEVRGEVAMPFTHANPCRPLASALACLVWQEYPGWLLVGIPDARVSADEAMLRFVSPLPRGGESIVDMHLVARANKVTTKEASYAYAPSTWGSLPIWITATLPALIAFVLLPWAAAQGAIGVFVLVSIALLITLSRTGSAITKCREGRRLNAADEAHHQSFVRRLHDLIWNELEAELENLPARDRSSAATARSESDRVGADRSSVLLRWLGVLGAIAAVLGAWQVLRPGNTRQRNLVADPPAISPTAQAQAPALHEPGRGILLSDRMLPVAYAAIGVSNKADTEQWAVKITPTGEWVARSEKEIREIDSGGAPRISQGVPFVDRPFPEWTAEAAKRIAIYTDSFCSSHASCVLSLKLVLVVPSGKAFAVTQTEVAVHDGDTTTRLHDGLPIPPGTTLAERIDRWFAGATLIIHNDSAVDRASSVNQGQVPSPALTGSDEGVFSGYTPTMLLVVRTRDETKTIWVSDAGIEELTETTGFVPGRGKRLAPGVPRFGRPLTAWSADVVDAVREVCGRHFGDEKANVDWQLSVTNEANIEFGVAGTGSRVVNQAHRKLLKKGPGVPYLREDGSRVPGEEWMVRAAGLLESLIEELSPSRQAGESANKPPLTVPIDDCAVVATLDLFSHTQLVACVVVTSTFERLGHSEDERAELWSGKGTLLSDGIPHQGKPLREWAVAAAERLSQRFGELEQEHRDFSFNLALQVNAPSGKVFASTFGKRGVFVVDGDNLTTLENAIELQDGTGKAREKVFAEWFASSADAIGRIAGKELAVESRTGAALKQLKDVVSSTIATARFVRVAPQKANLTESQWADLADMLREYHPAVRQMGYLTSLTVQRTRLFTDQQVEAFNRLGEFTDSERRLWSDLVQYKPVEYPLWAGPVVYIQQVHDTMALHVVKLQSTAQAGYLTVGHVGTLFEIAAWLQAAESSVREQNRRIDALAAKFGERRDQPALRQLLQNPDQAVDGGGNAAGGTLALAAQAAGNSLKDYFEKSRPPKRGKPAYEGQPESGPLAEPWYTGSTAEFPLFRVPWGWTLDDVVTQADKPKFPPPSGKIWDRKASAEVPRTVTITDPKLVGEIERALRGETPPISPAEGQAIHRAVSEIMAAQGVGGKRELRVKTVKDGKPYEWTISEKEVSDEKFASYGSWAEEATHRVHAMIEKDGLIGEDHPPFEVTFTVTSISGGQVKVFHNPETKRSDVSFRASSSSEWERVANGPTEVLAEDLAGWTASAERAIKAIFLEKLDR